jgi:nitrogen fixation/metabolism regulation signal transduction histidine kinase
MLLAALLARSLSRPLAQLETEARKVASGEAKPLDVRSSGEVGELARAFNSMLEDLGATRRRLAATNRVAAWREVARRVAHEVKNPLAPIRAAVETLRRLRARQDPAFDEYFDEATRTVLDEVHRISSIVTEFTRFARLPPPKPVDVDLAELARTVVKLHEAHAGGLRLKVLARGGTTHVSADRDQIVQVLTNLVQNAIDALAARGTGEVRVVVDGTQKDRVAISVVDDGPGIAPEMAARLFEPYATSKAQGTGLGLAIAQRIAIEHGGELAFVTPPGATGAEFRLTLPVDGPPPVSEMTPSPPSG